jgi:hypothetical protein
MKKAFKSSKAVTSSELIVALGSKLEITEDISFSKALDVIADVFSNKKAFKFEPNLG